MYQKPRQPTATSNAESDGRNDEQDRDRGGRAAGYGKASPMMETNDPQEGPSSGTMLAGGTYNQAQFGSRHDDRRRFTDARTYGGDTTNYIQDQRQVTVHNHLTYPLPQGSYVAYPPGHYGPIRLDMMQNELPVCQSIDTTHQIVDPHPSIQPGRNVKQLTSDIEVYVDQPLSKMAHVYPGKQRMGVLEPRDVAIKVTRYSDRKMREAQNLMKLMPHVNVVSIIHADQVKQSIEKRLYIVMEMCNPLTLEDYIEKRKEQKIPFNPNEAIEFSKQLIEGVFHIHNNNIIHRDLKPNGVLFSMCGKFLKIVDFGVSKALKYGLSQMSLSTLPIGTDGFRAPETYNCDQIRKESDIFSLAILLYHVWSYGYHPFGEKYLSSYNIKEHNPPVLTGLLVPDKETAVDLLNGMLENDPAVRSTIVKVRSHDFNTQAVNTTLTKSAEILWTGSIEKSLDCNAKLDDCVIYRERDVQDTGIERHMKLELSLVPSLNVSMLCIPVEKRPDGYLGIKQACSKCLREYFKYRESEENKSVMGWISLFDEQGKRTRTILVFRPPGYDELYGVLIRNPERLISELENNAGGSEETAVKELVDEMREEPRDQSEDVRDENMIDMSDASIGRSTAEHGTMHEEESEPAAEMPEDVTPRQAEPRLSVPIGDLALIPWWVHNPDTP